MWHQFWIPVLLPTLIIKTNCDNKTEDSNNIFIRYGGHAEADYSNRMEPKTTVAIQKPSTVAKPIIEMVTTKKFSIPSTTTKSYEVSTESVLFVPNKQSDRNNEEYYDRSNLKMKDIMLMRTVNDAMNKNIRVETDSPNDNVYFITGKNHDYEKPQKSEEYYSKKEPDYDLSNRKTEEEFKLDCSDLNCNNTINSICGTKYINSEWKYRLFMNDCYFRKVNCGFKYQINRYKEVNLEKCKTVGAHVDRPFSFKPKPFLLGKDEDKDKFSARRTSSSRRSMTMNYNGQFCSHPCPITCSDDYDPQCAVSGTGQRRVFLNHCKLDHNSCSYSVVWHKRPLAECVGGKKADMRHNRGFIGWMQRVGIVDNKGRLVLE